MHVVKNLSGQQIAELDNNDLVQSGSDDQDGEQLIGEAYDDLEQLEREQDDSMEEDDNNV